VQDKPADKKPRKKKKKKKRNKILSFKHVSHEVLKEKKMKLSPD